MDIKVKFTSKPRDDNGPYTITITRRPSTGITLIPNKSNPITVNDIGTTQVPTSGFIEVFNLSAEEIVITGITYQQLIDGYLLEDLPCDCEVLMIKSNKPCNIIEKMNMLGFSGNPYVKLSLDNLFDNTETLTSTISIRPFNYQTYNAIPTGGTITLNGIGKQSQKFKLYQGKYYFKFNITSTTNTSDNEYKFATLTFNECGDYPYVEPDLSIPIVPVPHCGDCWTGENDDWECGDVSDHLNQEDNCF